MNEQTYPYAGLHATMAALWIDSLMDEIAEYLAAR